MLKKESEVKAEELVEVIETKPKTDETVEIKPETTVPEETPELVTDITTKKRKIKTKKRDSVTEEKRVPDIEKETEVKVEELVEVIETKPKTDETVEIKPETTVPEETPELVTDITTKKRKIKTKKRDSVTEEKVVPDIEKETEVKVEELVEVIETKPKTDETVEIKPETTVPEETPKLVTDITTKKRKIKTKKRDSLTEEVVPDVEKETEVKVEELVEVIETKPKTDESVEIKPETTVPEETPELVTDITTKKRKIKTKKRDSLTEEVVPDVEKESEVKAEELIEVIETKPKTDETVEIKPETTVPEETPELVTDITTKKRKIKTKKRDSVTEEEVVPDVEKESEVKAEELVEVIETKPKTDETVEIKPETTVPEETPELVTDITAKKRKIKTKKRDSVTEEEVVPDVEKESEVKAEELVEVIETKPKTDETVEIKPETTIPEETPELVTDITAKKRKIKTKKRDSVTEEEVVPDVEKESEVKVEELVEVIETKPKAEESLEIKPETTVPEETSELVTDITTKKRKIKTKKRDSVTEEEVVPDFQKETEVIVEELVEVIETKPKAEESLEMKPETTVPEETPELVTDIITKKRKIKTKKRDSVTEEEVVPDFEKESEVKVEELVEVIETKPKAEESLEMKPETTFTEETPELVTDITTKKRKIKTKKRDSVTEEEVVPDFQKETEVKVEELVEVIETKPKAEESLEMKPETTVPEETPELVTDITTKKRKIKTKKRDSVTEEEVVPDFQKETEVKVEELVEVIETKPKAEESLEMKPETTVPEETPELVTDITTKKRKIKTKKRDSVTEEEVVPDFQKETEVKVEELVEVIETKPKAEESLEMKPETTFTEETPELVTDITTKKRKIKTKKRDSVTEEEVVPDFQKETEVKVEELFEVIETKPKAEESLEIKPETTVPEETPELVTDITTKKRKIKTKKRDSVTEEEVVPDFQKETEVIVEELVEVIETKPKAEESLEMKPETTVPEETPELVTDIITKKRKIKTKKRDSVTEEEVVPDFEKESEVKVEELVEVIETKPKAEESLEMKPETTFTEETPELVTDITTKKRKIKTKKRDSVTEEEVVPDFQKETEVKVEELVEVIETKPKAEESLEMKPETTVPEETPELVTDITTKKRKIKTKKRDSVTEEEVVPDFQKETEVKVEELVEVIETKPKAKNRLK